MTVWWIATQVLRLARNDGVDAIESSLRANEVKRGNPQETLANIMDCHEFATQNKRSAVSLVIKNQTRLTQKMDCHDLTSSSLAMTDKEIDCHANANAFARNDDGRYRLPRIATQNKRSAVSLAKQAWCGFFSK